MKKTMALIFAYIILLFSITYAQTEMTEGGVFSQSSGTARYSKDKGKDYIYVRGAIPISLSKASTYVTGEFETLDFITTDSLESQIGVVQWSATDSCIVTITLESRNRNIVGAQPSWKTVGTIITSYYGTGTDTLYGRGLVPRGSIASNVTDLVSLANKLGELSRLKFTFASPTTVGNGGIFRFYLYMKK